MKSNLVIESLSAIEHILKHRPSHIYRVTFLVPSHNLNARLSNIHELLIHAKVPIAFHPMKSESPIRAEIFPFKYLDFESWVVSLEDRKHTLVLALDHIQDPQNFGALLRTADAFKVSGVLIPKDRSAEVSPGVYHASVGAVETVSIVRVTNLSRALSDLKEAGFWIVGTALGSNATIPWKMPEFEKVVLVLGTESQGLSQGIEKKCDWNIEIPLEGSVSSLNVSVAGSLLLYELWRRIKVTTAS